MNRPVMRSMIYSITLIGYDNMLFLIKTAREAHQCMKAHALDRLYSIDIQSIFKRLNKCYAKFLQNDNHNFFNINELCIKEKKIVKISCIFDVQDIYLINHAQRQAHK